MFVIERCAGGEVRNGKSQDATVVAQDAVPLREDSHVFAAREVLQYMGRINELNRVVRQEAENQRHRPRRPRGHLAGRRLPQVDANARVDQQQVNLAAFGFSGANPLAPGGNPQLHLYTVGGGIRSEADAEAAIESARQGFAMWSKMTGAERGRILQKAVQLLREREGGFLVLPVVDDEGRLHGMLHAKDMMNG